MVETHAMDVPMLFHDFDDYWTPFLGGEARPRAMRWP
jgi:hypothetical protein